MTEDLTRPQPVAGTMELAKFPLTLLAALSVACAATLWAPPAGRTSWMLEVGPGLLGVAALIGFFKRFPMTRMVYVGVLIHTCILIYGGCYTYALTPLGNWARDAFHLSRNHYDRVGHFALGFFPVLILREVLLRRTPLQRGGWLTFILLSIVLAIGAFWELIEWWTTLIVASDTGTAFLGSQGDVWDAQQDMLYALIGAAISLPLLSGLHDRAMVKLGVYRA